MPTSIMSGNFRMIKTTLLFFGFLAVLNETYLNVSLRTFMQVFDVSISVVQWLTTGFMLVMTVVVPISAFFIQSFTTRQIFFVTMGLIILGTEIGGCSQSFWMLLAGRIIQASGTCVLMALLTNTIWVITPLAQRGTAIGMIGLVVLFAPAIAPTFAGIILQQLAWRWLFFMILPFLILALVLGAVCLKNITIPIKVPFDIMSLGLSILGFGGILYSISMIGMNGFSIIYMVEGLIGLLGLAAFVYRQMSLKIPVLQLRVFAYPMFSLGVFLVMGCMTLAFAVALLTPMVLHDVMGLSVFMTGIAMLPGGIMNGVTALIAGKLFDEIGPKRLIVVAAILMTATAWGFSEMSSSTSLWIFILLNCFILISIAAIITPAQTNGLNQLPKRYYSHGTEVMLTLQQLAGGLGTAVFVGIMAIGEKKYLQTTVYSDNIMQYVITTGFNDAFKVALVLSVMVLIAALFLKRGVIRCGDE